MNAVDILALLVQFANTTATLTKIAQQMHAEGRTELTQAEQELVRGIALASEDRLAKALAS